MYIKSHNPNRNEISIKEDVFQVSHEQFFLSVYIKSHHPNQNEISVKIMYVRFVTNSFVIIIFGIPSVLFRNLSVLFIE